MHLSVVIPVYNVASYLPACLDSLIAQTRQADEVIAVNDGSTDTCLEILSQYTQKMPSLKIINQPNQGLSVARNVGVNNVTGDYIHFLDSDDFLSPDAYEKVTNTIQALQPEVLLFNGYYFYEKRKPEKLIYSDNYNFKVNQIITGQEFLIECLEHERLAHMVWLHCYKADFIKNNKFNFIPKRIHEDVVWTTQVLYKAEKVVYINQPLVHYRIAERKFSPDVLDQKMLNLIGSSIANAQDLINFLESFSSSKLKDLLSEQAVDGGLSVFHQLKKIANHNVHQNAKALIRNSNYFKSLWMHADSKQKRKLLSRWIRFKLGMI